MVFPSGETSNDLEKPTVVSTAFPRNVKSAANSLIGIAPGITGAVNTLPSSVTGQAVNV